MKLTLSWEKTAGRVIPFCSSSLVNKDGISPLACLLMDDGGQDYLHTVPWIDEGVTRVDAVIRGDVCTWNWDREVWGAKLKPDEVEVYSLLEENCSELIATPPFRHAIVIWREFIRSTPEFNTKHEVEIY